MHDHRTASPPGAAFLDIAGGCAIFVGVDSPLTQAVGLGLNGPVNEDDVDRLEDFFRSRGARISLDYCPLAAPSLLEILSHRGYHATEFNNVLVKALANEPYRPPAPRVRRALAGEERPLGVHRGSRLLRPGRPHHRRNGTLAAPSSAMPGALCYLAVAPTGELAGGGALAVREKSRHSLRRQHYRRLSGAWDFTGNPCSACLNEAIALGSDIGHRVHPAGQHLTTQFRTPGLRSGLYQGHAGLLNYLRRSRPFSETIPAP